MLRFLVRVRKDRQALHDRRNAKLDLSSAVVSVFIDVITGNNNNHYHLLSFLVCIAGTCVIFMLTTFDGTNSANSSFVKYGDPTRLSHPVPTPFPCTFETYSFNKSFERDATGNTNIFLLSLTLNLSLLIRTLKITTFQ